MAVKGVIYTKKKHIWNLKISGGIGWGGGQRRGGIWGDDCTSKLIKMAGANRGLDCQIRVLKQ